MAERPRTDAIMNTGKPQVLIYARSRCGYCTRALQLLDRKGIAYTHIDVEAIAGARAQMQQRSGRDTVPQIFIGDRHLGGFDDINALDNAGELDQILGLPAAREIQPDHTTTRG